MKTLIVETKKTKDVVNITREVQAVVDEAGVANGTCHVLLLHTTAAITVANLDGETDLETLQNIEVSGNDQGHNHAHFLHVPGHVLASLFGKTLVLPIENGKVVLGTLQEVQLIELNGPKQRSLAVWVA